MMLHLTIVIVSWLLSVAAAFVSLMLGLGEPEPRAGLSFTLSCMAFFVGYLGFGHWSPFRFPQVGYMWTSGDSTIYLASSWFFVVPLILASISVVLVFARCVRGVGRSAKCPLN